MPDSRAQHKNVPLNGKLITGEPASIGMNFRTLKNMRYTDTHIRGVQGMTKINSNVMNATYLKTRSAFHLRKYQPAESHLLVQAYNTGLTASQVLENKTAIPSTGQFEATELWTDSSGAGLGRFSEAPDGQMIYCNGVDSCIWGGEEMKVGAFITATAEITTTVTDPKDRTDAMNNLLDGTNDIAEIDSADASHFLVGSPRPIQGLEIYIKTANETASTMTGKYWNGSSWAVLTLTDETNLSNRGGVPPPSSNDATLEASGVVTFDSTVTTAKPKYLEGYYLYWYQFTISAGDAEIYHVTLDAPMQDIVDIWDGVYRDIIRAFHIKDSKYEDCTTKLIADDYDKDLTSTWLKIDGAESYPGNDWLEFGFSEKMIGIRFYIPSDDFNNDASTMSVDYWNGSAYTTVGTIVDGTDSSGDTLAESGVVSWNSHGLSEVTKSVNNSPPLYYYRVRWSAGVSDYVRISYVSGIPAQADLSEYKFPVFAQGRVLLCCDMAGDKHRATCSGKFMPQSYNGDDSVDLYFGGDGELTAGTELFSLYGSSLYSIILMFKDNETWAVSGQDINEWEGNTFILSKTIGCPAPLTLKTVNLSAELGEGVNRNLAIWQGANGVYVSDGRAPIPIHLDIKEYFDRTDSRCIKASMIGDSRAWVDADKQEYHLLVASGSSATTLNKELVYDVHRNKWFEIDRTVDLQCGVEVIDTDGNPYTYGFLDTGYMERLEYGTTFDGNDIVHTFQTGDFPLSDLAMETRLSRAKLITVSKTTTSNDITCTHYSDGGTTETAVAAVGTITMSGVATADETFVIDTQTFTWKAARSTTGEVTIGANAAAAVTNLVTAINADLDNVTAEDGAGDTVTVTADSTGEQGNAIIFTEDSTNMAMDGSGTLGGTTAGIYSEGSSFTMSPTKSGFRITIPELIDKLDGDPFHSFKFAMTTDNETIGFEPLALVLTFHEIAED